jgi:hypothetical protein
MTGVGQLSHHERLLFRMALALGFLLVAVRLVAVAVLWYLYLIR